MREFAEAARDFGWRVGFYTPWMNWHHPDGGRAGFDPDGRARFTDHLRVLKRELMTNSGKIDILWTDVDRWIKRLGVKRRGLGGLSVHPTHGPGVIALITSVTEVHLGFKRWAFGCH